MIASNALADAYTRLHSPLHSPSNAYSIAPTLAPTNAYTRPCHTPPIPPRRVQALARGPKHRSCRPHSDTAALALRSRPNALDRTVTT